MSVEKRTKLYPRAVPYRAPELPEAFEAAPEVPPTPANLRSRSSGFNYPLACLALFALLVIAGVGTAIWWRQNGLAGRDESLPTTAKTSAGDTDSPAPSPSPSRSSAAPVPAAAPVKKPAPAAPAVAKIKPQVGVSGQAAATPAPPTVPRERYLEALGSLTASHLYQTYLNIGLIADAVENEQMELAEAEKTLAHVVRLMTVVEKQLEQVAGTDLDPGDRDALKHIRQLCDALRSQTAALQSYWATDDLDQAALFHEARTKAWTGINAMLGLETMEMETPMAAEAGQ